MESRCGLQISRDNTITNEVHNHPREKQVGCLINGNILTPGESMEADDFTATTANNELLNQRDIKAAQRQNAQAQKLGLNDLALGNITGNISKLTSSLTESKDEQKGLGFKSIIGKLGRLLPVKKIGQSVASTISNSFPDSDKNARNIYPGENHAIVQLPNDKFGRANYTGPGTRVVDRVKRNDPPRVLSDMVSKAHDIRYTLADNTHNVREADLKMLSSLRKLESSGSDRSINIAPAMLGIRGKVALEDFGLLSRNAFIDTEAKLTEKDEKLLRDELWELEQKGYGLRDRGVGTTTGRINMRPSLSDASRRGSRYHMKQPAALMNMKKMNKYSYIDPQPGTSSTQSLAGKFLDGREVILDRHSSNLRKFNSELNTRSHFSNRLFDTNQTGSGQHPGLASSSSVDKIKSTDYVVGTFKASDYDSMHRGVARRPASIRGRDRDVSTQRGGSGWPGVNPIQINVKPKLMIPIAEQFAQSKKPPTTQVQNTKSSRQPVVPGKRLLNGYMKKIENRKKKKSKIGSGQLANQFKSGSRKLPPLYMDDYGYSSKIAADMIMPVIRVN